MYLFSVEIEEIVVNDVENNVPTDEELISPELEPNTNSNPSEN